MCMEWPSMDNLEGRSIDAGGSSKGSHEMGMLLPLHHGSDMVPQLLEKGLMGGGGKIILFFF